MKSKCEQKSHNENSVSDGDNVNDNMTNGLANLNISTNHVTNGCHGDISEAGGDHLRYPVNLDLEHVLGKMPRKVAN